MKVGSKVKAGEDGQDGSLGRVVGRPLLGGPSFIEI